MFGPFSKQSENLLNLYLLSFRISFYKNKKQAEENLDILFSVLNETMDVSEWNRALKSLAKAWGAEVSEIKGIVEINKTKQNILDKILYNSENKRLHKFFKSAEQNTKDLCGLADE